jgi:hypothetical protein
MLNDEDAEKRREDAEKRRELEAIEAYLGERFAFSLPQAAQALSRSTTWARQKARSGKLKTVWLDGQQIVIRPTLVSAYLDGI